MKTQKREINPAITLQREQHQAAVKSLKDKSRLYLEKIERLEKEIFELRNKLFKLQEKTQPNENDNNENQD